MLQILSLVREFTAVIFVLIGVALGPTVISSVADINATLLADVPLSGVIILLATYVPAFYYLANISASVELVILF